MVRPPYILDARTAAELYRDAILLARSYTPDWAEYWPPDQDWFSTDDPGQVIFKILSRLHDALNSQLARAPDKRELAFFDFFGLGLRPPRAASTPLSFALAAGSGPVLMDRSTQVASNRDGNLLFQLTEDLLALPAFPIAAYAILPAADTYAAMPSLVGGTGVSTDGFQPIDHALYLGSAALFHQEQTVAELRVIFEGVNLFEDYFARWSDGAGNTLNPEIDLEVYDALEASFTDFSQIEASVVGGISSYWIAVRPAPGVRVRPSDAEILPQIYGISVEVRSRPVAPEATYFNSTPVDTLTGAYPFEKEPAVEDAFYIASADVFGRAGADITLAVEAQPIEPPTPVELAWEYWAEGAWHKLEVLDSTLSLTRSGTIRFVCPIMDLQELNGQNSRWVRARIAAGGYGEPAGMVVTRSAEFVVNDIIGAYVTDKEQAVDTLEAHDLNFGFEYRPATYTPPHISALDLGYTLVDRPEYALALNELELKPLAIRPYQPASEQTAAYYFGFEPDSFLTHLSGRTLSLLVVLGEDDTGADESARSSASWSAYDGNTWRALEVQDGTDEFTSSGIVRLEIPIWIAAAELFSTRAVWLRLSAPQSDPRQLPPIARLVPNAVDAINGILWTEEILGSGTGAPGLSLEFPRHPVLEGQVVQVFEPAPVMIGDLPGGTPLAGGTTSDQATWVTWVEVPNLSFATPGDRHYVLDHATGLLSFGDGVRGLVPPRGVDNIRAERYRSGGGIQGNVAAEELTVLQSAKSELDAVTNPLPAQGGADADGLEVLRKLGPKRMRAGGRAVTADDLATMALESSQHVARATAYTDDSGRTILALLPQETGLRPAVTPVLVREVERYVKDRSLFVATSLLETVGPNYVPIAVDVRARLEPGANEADVDTKLVARIDEFFTPLGSAIHPEGWDFGATIYAAQLAEALRGVAGVERIEAVSFSEEKSTLSMRRNELPTTGAVRLEVSDGG